MAVVKATMTELPVAGVGQAYAVSWPNMQNGDTGEPVSLHDYHDRSVQVTGTFGSGGSCRIEGSNDGTNFYALNDPASTALNISSASIRGVLEAVKAAQPHITAGDGTTSLTVTMFLRRTR